MQKYLIVLLLTSFSILAQTPDTNTRSTKIYKYKDSNGNIIFTNSPPTDESVQPIKLNPIQSMPSAKTSNTSTNKKDQDQNNTNNALNLRFYLDGIPNDEALRANNGDFTVTIKANGDITDSSNTPYFYQLLVDGKQSGDTQANPSFHLSNLSRGAHTLIGNVIRKGAIIATTGASTFTIQRVNTNLSPALRPKPKPQPRAN